MARLKRQLTLFDLFVISAGAMFSSGFFLLPGIAAQRAGPAVVLAYFLSALLMIPALVSQAELATAMPRAGGAYYFLDRTLGPLVGVISGVGTWLTLMLKSAFALIGMGAYLALMLDLPSKPVAVGFTVVFGILNVFGARQSSGLLRVLVLFLFAILGLFIVHGLAVVWGEGAVALHRERFTPFLESGVDGLLGTVGLVFVSYVGLTKIASLAEEAQDTDRNLPLAMFLSLTVVTTIYVAGVYIMVMVLGVDELGPSLTPVADAAGAFFSWLPPGAGELLIAAAAIAAFTSMANAGILAASRYPLAMARDRLIPERFATIGRWRTPVLAIATTCALIVACILVLNVEAVAKVASALQLLLFALLNLAVIVMRESQIESYDPGFRSPLYPWLQVAGIAFPFFLVAEMGWLPALFAAGVVAACIPWYVYYARDRIAREGAIFHVFARLGRRRFVGLDRELRDIMKERGVRAEDPFDEVVARATVIDLDASGTLSDVVGRAAAQLATRLDTEAETLRSGLVAGLEGGGTPMANGAALVHTRLPGADACEMVLVRCRGALAVDVGDERTVERAAREAVHALFVVVSGDTDPGRHLRILAQLAGRMEQPEFLEGWLAGRDEQELKETLLRDDRFLAIRVRSDTRTEELIGRALKDLRMPEGCLVALIRRFGVTMVPRGRTVLREGDRLTIIGEPAALREFAVRYGDRL